MALTTSTAPDALRQRLDAAGFSTESPNLALLWSVLCEWCRDPVKDVDVTRDGDRLRLDGVLYDEAPDRWSRGRRFVLAFTREFAFDDVDDVQQERQSVDVTVEYALTDEFRAISEMRFAGFGSADQIWGTGGPSAAEWIEQVEQSNSYRVALRHTPSAASVSAGTI